MPDQYYSFEELSRSETAGIDYRILLRQAAANFAIVAPHGGGIEPGTSEIAGGIAGDEFSFYAFEGVKTEGNDILHITSTRFDEPLCLTLIKRCSLVITIHGEESTADGEGVFVGGLNVAVQATLRAALEAKGFDVRKHPSRKLQGLEPENICNRGTSGKGVQFELSRTVREQMFKSLTKEGRRRTTPKFTAFVDAIRSVLKGQTAAPASGASL